MTAAVEPIPGAALVRLVGPVSVRCSGCLYGRDGNGEREWLAMRAAAQRHVRRHGHTVVANVGHLFTYSPAPAARRGAHL